MPAELRERLVAAAHAAGTDLVVDESFVDLPLDGAAMPPPVAAFDRHARVLTIGGMSKPYWGGLRIGWVRASAPHGAAAGRRAGRRRHGRAGAGPARRRAAAAPTPTTIVAGPPRRSSPPSATRCVAALRDELPEWRFDRAARRRGLWAELDGAGVQRAGPGRRRSSGCGSRPGPRFGLDGTLERFLRLPFTLPAADLVEAVRRLAAARYDLGPRPAAGTPGREPGRHRLRPPPACRGAGQVGPVDGSVGHPDGLFRPGQVGRSRPELGEGARVHLVDLGGEVGLHATCA